METIYDLGISLILFLQSLGNWIAIPMKLITELGNEEFYLLVAPILYWCIDSRLGLRISLLLMFSIGFNNVFKVFMHAPRPYWIDTQVRALGVETSFGIPSGHAQNATAAWGLLAVKLKARWAWTIACIIILLIGLSRIYLGVHFPSDVLAGWLLGGLILWAFLKLEAPVGAWLAALTSLSRLLAALGASLALILLGVLARFSLGAWTVPIEWVQNAIAATGITEPINPLAYSGLVTGAGALFGLAAGAIFISFYGGFEAGGPVWKRGVRFVIGVGGVVLLWSGLGAVFPTGEMLLALVLRYLRYALVGVWVTGLAPWLFVRSGLAEGSRNS